MLLYCVFLVHLGLSWVDCKLDITASVMTSVLIVLIGFRSLSSCFTKLWFVFLFFVFRFRSDSSHNFFPRQRCLFVCILRIFQTSLFSGSSTSSLSHKSSRTSLCTIFFRLSTIPVNNPPGPLLTMMMALFAALMALLIYFKIDSE